MHTVGGDVGDIDVYMNARARTLVTARFGNSDRGMYLVV